jgi:hypothetical protein
MEKKTHWGHERYPLCIYRQSLESLNSFVRVETLMMNKMCGKGFILSPPLIGGVVLRNNIFQANSVHLAEKKY